MFLVRLIRQLAGLPALWLGQLLAMLKLPAAGPVLRVAYAIDRHGDTAHLALAMVSQHEGMPAASALGAQWAREHGCSEAAAFASLGATRDGDMDLAREYLDLSRSLGRDRTGLSDLAEYAVCSAAMEGDPAAQAEYWQRTLQRTDLPMQLSRLLTEQLMWRHLRSGGFVEAGRLARRILDIEPSAGAEIVLWGLSLRDGDLPSADRHFARAETDPVQKSVQAIWAAWSVGRLDVVEGLQSELASHAPEQADQLASLLQTAPPREASA